MFRGYISFGQRALGSEEHTQVGHKEAASLLGRVSVAAGTLLVFRFWAHEKPVQL